MMENTIQEKPILQVQDLVKTFPVSRGIVSALLRRKKQVVHAVDGVSFDVQRGEILALVGESGSGKTTVGMNVLGLQEPDRGHIFFDGVDIPEWARGQVSPGGNGASAALAGLARRQQVLALRRRAQMIFQDPYGALIPSHKIFEIVSEPLEVHNLAQTKEEKVEKARAALEACGMIPASDFFERLPDELSGGQRQRVVIASALVMEPELLVADEPVSMLDVSIRAEILSLLHKLRRERGITILYTTHDLATAGYFTDRMAVMYLGRIVELGPTRQVLANPRHPYTQALLSVVPAPNPRRRRARLILKGEIPNPIEIPAGCRFHPRCPQVTPDCSKIDPVLRIVEDGHLKACILD
jgi:peptide/nickel transport system ATP-binding protein